RWAAARSSRIAIGAALYGAWFISAPRRLGEDRRDPGRRRAFDALAPAALEIGFPAIAAPARVAGVGGGGGLTLAAELFDALADRGEIVGGARAVHRVVSVCRGG